MAKKNKYKCSLFPYEREDFMSIQEVSQNAGWNISAFNLPEAWQLSQGEGIVIAVLDSGCDLDHPDLAENLLEGINLVSPGKPPEDDNGHGCESPSSLIYTTFSGIDTIENMYNSVPEPELMNFHDKSFNAYIKDVNHLDIKTYSLGEDGKTNIGKLTYLHKVPIDCETVKIVLEGNIEFELTPWHPVYLFEKSNHSKNKFYRKRADLVEVGDRFGCCDGTIKLPFEYQIIEIFSHFKCSSCNLNKKTAFCKRCEKNSVIYNDRFVLNEDLAYLLGIVLTDGYVNKKYNRVEITSETPEILNKCRSILDKLNFKSIVRDNIRLIINSKKLANLLISCGVFYKDKSYFQTMPYLITKSPYSCITAFIAGAIDGDGCISKSNTKNRLTTVSRPWANSFCMLLNSIGISCGMIDSKNTPFSSKIDRKINLEFPIINCVFSALPNEVVQQLVHPIKKLRASKLTRCKRKVRRVKSVTRQSYNGYFYDFTVEKYNNYIANGHFVSNTHVTGTIVAANNDIGIVGVAPKAKVRPVKVLDGKGNGNLLNVAEGIRWATKMGVDFISMSLGSPAPVQEVRKAIQFAASKGIVTFVAAGNAGNTKEVFYPAAYPETIAVGAVDVDMRRAKFSNTGKNLDFMAPGVDILSTVPDDWYAKLSGTSMAQPFVCGVAALVKSYRIAQKSEEKLQTVADYINLFKKYTTPVVNGNYDDPHFYQGFGIIDPRKFFESMKAH